MTENEWIFWVWYVGMWIWAVISAVIEYCEQPRYYKTATILCLVFLWPWMLPYAMGGYAESKRARNSK